MTKAIIFDCFGVLVSDALQVLSSELHKRDPAAAAKIGKLARTSNRGQMDPVESSRQIAEILGLSFEGYRQRITDGESKNAQLMDYITELRKSYKTAMLSNINVGGLARRFSEEELREHFDEVVASGDIGYAKPEAEAYEIVAERLGVRLDECIFTDDREGYLESARAIGMRTILYKDFDQFCAELKMVLSQSES